MNNTTNNQDLVLDRVETSITEGNINREGFSDFNLLKRF